MGGGVEELGADRVHVVQADVGEGLLGQRQLRDEHPEQGRVEQARVGDGAAHARGPVQFGDGARVRRDHLPQRHPDRRAPHRFQVQLEQGEGLGRVAVDGAADQCRVEHPQLARGG